MNRIFKRIATAVLAVGIMATPMLAYATEQEVQPGDSYSIAYSEFYDSKGNALDAASDFTTSNFDIVKKTISKGSSLVKSIKINNRSHEVDITFEEDARVAPNSPNVIITNLAVRSSRAIKDGGYTIVKSGTTFTYDGDLEFRVGMSNNDREINRDGDDIYLESGESEYVRWRGGDSYGKVTIEYGDIAYATSRVVENDKVLYGFSDEVHDDILDRNSSAYIQGLDIKGTSFPNTLTLYILADKGDYIYENNEGQLKQSSAKWDSDEDAWVIKLTKGKSFIISDEKLRSAPYGSGSYDDDDDDDRYADDDDSSSSSGNNYYNPDTGGGSGSVVAVSAIVAILALAIVSIVMSTLLSSKSMKK